MLGRIAQWNKLFIQTHKVLIALLGDAAADSAAGGPSLEPLAAAASPLPASPAAAGPGTTADDTMPTDTGEQGPACSWCQPAFCCRPLPQSKSVSATDEICYIAHSFCMQHRYPYMHHLHLARCYAGFCLPVCRRHRAAPQSYCRLGVCDHPISRATRRHVMCCQTARPCTGIGAQALWQIPQPKTPAPDRLQAGRGLSLWTEVRCSFERAVSLQVWRQHTPTSSAVAPPASWAAFTTSDLRQYSYCMIGLAPAYAYKQCGGAAGPGAACKLGAACRDGVWAGAPGQCSFGVSG